MEGTASSIAKRRRVGGLATMPSRAEGLALVLNDILGQLDRLYIYLDGHTTVPEVARRKKVFPILPTTVGVWHSAGKFLGLSREDLDITYLTFDDDIRYPPDYVETLVAGLGRREGKAVVGIHGTFFQPPFEKFSRDRQVLPFMDGIAYDTEVDMLASGTTAFLPSRLPLAPGKWPYLDVDDLMLAINAETHGLPRIALARDPGYLRPIALEQPDSLALQMQKDDSRHTRYMRQLLALERRSARGLPPRPVLSAAATA